MQAGIDEPLLLATHGAEGRFGASHIGVDAEHLAVKLHAGTGLDFGDHIAQAGDLIAKSLVLCDEVLLIRVRHWVRRCEIGGTRDLVGCGTRWESNHSLHSVHTLLETRDLAAEVAVLCFQVILACPHALQHGQHPSDGAAALMLVHLVSLTVVVASILLGRAIGDSLRAVVLGMGIHVFANDFGTAVMALVHAKGAEL